jgi:hypothetical protein
MSSLRKARLPNSDNVETCLRSLCASEWQLGTFVRLPFRRCRFQAQSPLPRVSRNPSARDQRSGIRVGRQLMESGEPLLGHTSVKEERPLPGRKSATRRSRGTDHAGVKRPAARCSCCWRAARKTGFGCVFFHEPSSSSEAVPRFCSNRRSLSVKLGWRS